MKEKKEARREFEEAVASGKSAIYAQSDHRGENFSISLGAIRSDQNVVVQFR